jgi:hypothetical protein
MFARGVRMLHELNGVTDQTVGLITVFGEVYLVHSCHP